jgi:carbonic anhydrase
VNWSEHTLNGGRFSAELHTVHKQIDGDRYAAVGMMIQPDAFEDNEEFGLLLQGWYTKEQEVLAACGINLTTPEETALVFRDAYGSFIAASCSSNFTASCTAINTF